MQTVFAALLIGCAPNIVRFGSELGPGALGPQALVFWRFAFAAPVLAALLIWRRGRLPRRPSPALALAAIAFAVDVALWHWALGYTTVANSTFLVSMGNLCLGLTAWAVLGERPSRLWFVLLPVAIAGAFLLSQGGPGGMLGGATPDALPKGARLPSLRGDLLAIGAAICASLYLLCSKIARRSFDGLEAIFWLSAIGAVAAAGITIASGENFWPAELRFFLVPLALGLVVQVGGQGLLVGALGRLPAARVASLWLLQPLSAACLSFALFGERPAPLQMAGAAAILLAVWLVAVRRPAEPARPNRTPPSGRH